MKVYLVEAEEHSWDEFDSFVVLANSAGEALELAIKKVRDRYRGSTNFDTGADITEIDLEGVDIPRVLLGSFNAS